MGLQLILDHLQALLVRLFNLILHHQILGQHLRPLEGLLQDLLGLHQSVLGHLLVMDLHLARRVLHPHVDRLLVLPEEEESQCLPHPDLCRMDKFLKCSNHTSTPLNLYLYQRAPL